MHPSAPDPGGPPTAITEAAPSTPSGTPAVPQVDDQEKPGRILHGWTDRLVAVAAFAVAVLTIGQVFRPLSQGSQFYLIVFLAGSLPLVYLVYRSGLRGFDPEDRPGALD
ncbi:MAG: C4-dicarboxylate ABC transporter permease, partial [Mycobacterium sp.]